MDRLRVRAYNVRFGDAILVSVPDRGEDGVVTMRHLLIDVGNVLAGSGGQDDVFEPVIEDILQVLGDEPLDLYVMTHEHMDHVQGLFWAKRKRDLEVRARHAWLTASAAPDYYDRHPEARKKRLAFENLYDTIALYYRTSAAEVGSAVEAMLLNNNPRSTKDCVAYLRDVADETTYVFRGADIEESHPFQEATFEIWGPEEDTSIYYGAFRPMAFTRLPAAGGDASDDSRPNGERDVEGESTVVKPLPDPLPPPGVDAGAFYNLVERRRGGVFDNLRRIDKAANDSSVVFVLQWRGWRLLFPGDAEERAWKEMNKRCLLSPVHFLKVGHHGSHNGTPGSELLEKLLPGETADARERSALVSTHEGTYNAVPDVLTLEELGDRCAVSRIGAADDPLFVDLFFEAP